MITVRFGPIEKAIVALGAIAALYATVTLPVIG